MPANAHAEMASIPVKIRCLSCDGLNDDLAKFCQ